MEDQRTSERVSLNDCTTIVEFLDPDIRRRYRLPARDLSDRAVGLVATANHPIQDDFELIFSTPVWIRCPRGITRERESRQARLYRVERLSGGQSIWVFKFEREFPIDRVQSRRVNGDNGWK